MVRQIIKSDVAHKMRVEALLFAVNERRGSHYTVTIYIASVNRLAIAVRGQGAEHSVQRRRGRHGAGDR